MVKIGPTKIANSIYILLSVSVPIRPTDKRLGTLDKIKPHNINNNDFKNDL